MIKIVSYEHGYAVAQGVRVKPFEVAEIPETHLSRLLKSHRRILALEDFKRMALEGWPHSTVCNMARRRGIEGAREATEGSVRAALAAIELPLDEAQALLVIEATPEPVAEDEAVDAAPTAEREAPTPAQVGLISGDSAAPDYMAQLAEALDADAYAAVRTLVAEQQHAPKTKAELYAIAARILGREEG